MYGTPTNNRLRRLALQSLLCLGIGMYARPFVIQRLSTSCLLPNPGHPAFGTTSTPGSGHRGMQLSQAHSRTKSHIHAADGGISSPSDPHSSRLLRKRPSPRTQRGSKALLTLALVEITASGALAGDRRRCGDVPKTARMRRIIPNGCLRLPSALHKAYKRITSSRMH